MRAIRIHRTHRDAIFKVGRIANRHRRVDFDVAVPGLHLQLPFVAAGNDHEDAGAPLAAKLLTDRGEAAPIDRRIVRPTETEIQPVNRQRCTVLILRGNVIERLDDPCVLPFPAIVEHLIDHQLRVGATPADRLSFYFRRARDDSRHMGAVPVAVLIGVQPPGRAGLRAIPDGGNPFREVWMIRPDPRIQDRPGNALAARRVAFERRVGLQDRAGSVQQLFLGGAAPDSVDVELLVFVGNPPNLGGVKCAATNRLSKSMRASSTARLESVAGRARITGDLTHERSQVARGTLDATRQRYGRTALLVLLAPLTFGGLFLRGQGTRAPGLR